MLDDIEMQLLRQAIKRNPERFPADCMFLRSGGELEIAPGACFRFGRFCSLTESWSRGTRRS